MSTTNSLIRIIIFAILLVTIASTLGCQKAPGTDDLEVQLHKQRQKHNQLQQQINILLASANTNYNAIVDLQNWQAQVQININSLLVRVAVLEGYTNIVGIVDVCGDAPGKIDEVLLKLSNGQYLASFSANQSGDYTRFAILPNGGYMTTDQTNCAFTVQNGVVQW